MTASLCHHVPLNKVVKMGTTKSRNKETRNEKQKRRNMASVLPGKSHYYISITNYLSYNSCRINYVLKPELALTYSKCQLSLSSSADPSCNYFHPNCCHCLSSHTAQTSLTQLNTVRVDVTLESVIRL